MHMVRNAHSCEPILLADPAVKDTITDNMIREADIKDFDPCVQWLQTGQVAFLITP